LGRSTRTRSARNGLRRSFRSGPMIKGPREHRALPSLLEDIPLAGAELQVEAFQRATIKTQGTIRRACIQRAVQSDSRLSSVSRSLVLPSDSSRTRCFFDSEVRRRDEHYSRHQLRFG
jgi:hypothetical protein